MLKNIKIFSFLILFFFCLYLTKNTEQRYLRCSVFLQSDYIKKTKTASKRKPLLKNSRTKGFYFLGKLKPLSLGQFALRKTLHLLGKDCFSLGGTNWLYAQIDTACSTVLHKEALGFCFAKLMPLALQDCLTFF